MVGLRVRASAWKRALLASHDSLYSCQIILSGTRSCCWQWRIEGSTSDIFFFSFFVIVDNNICIRIDIVGDDSVL